MLFTSSFTSCTGQVKHSKVQVHPLTLGQFVLPPMWSICIASHAKMKVTCFGDVSNSRRTLVACHPIQSDACLSQLFFCFLMNSGDMVSQRFATFRTRLWPTKTPTGMVFSHSKLCDLVRGRKVGCSSLIAKKHGVSVRAANKLWKTAHWSVVAASCEPYTI